MNSADPIYYEELKLRARHNRNNPTEAESYLWDDDSVRTAFLEGHGYKVIRFRNEDVVANTDFVLQSIKTNLLK